MEIYWEFWRIFQSENSNLQTVMILNLLGISIRYYIFIIVYPMDIIHGHGKIVKVMGMQKESQHINSFIDNDWSSRFCVYKKEVIGFLCQFSAFFHISKVHWFFPQIKRLDTQQKGHYWKPEKGNAYGLQIESYKSQVNTQFTHKYRA